MIRPVLVIVKDVTSRDGALSVALKYFSQEYAGHTFNPDTTVVVEVPAEQECVQARPGKWMDALGAPQGGPKE